MGILVILTIINTAILLGVAVSIVNKNKRIDRLFRINADQDIQRKETNKVIFNIVQFLDMIYKEIKSTEE